MRFRKLVKKYSTPLNLDGHLRNSYVGFGLLGEKLGFLLNGSPETSSTIILAGSGRSGTTWVGDMIASSTGVQQIFEPLIPLWNSKVRTMTGWDRTDPYFREIYLRPGGDYPEWRAHLESILLGKYRNYWTDFQRDSVFPQRYLVKEIRMNLMLGYIIDQFNCPVIYLLRHPCAVINSRLNLPIPWHADVRDILVQEDLVDDYLHDWIQEIEREKDLLGAHAVWWAVENHVALSQLASRPHKVIYYENVMSQSNQMSEEISAWLGLPNIRRKSRVDTTKKSRMTRPESIGASQNILLQEWQNRLSQEDQQRILGWAERLGVTSYSFDVLPRFS